MLKYFFIYFVISEHSRHWFFKGRMIVDGHEHDSSLFKMVMSTQESSNQNNVIKFSDNSRYNHISIALRSLHVYLATAYLYREI